MVKDGDRSARGVLLMERLGRVRVEVCEVAVQKGDVARVDASLHGLGPVALLQPLGGDPLALGQQRPFELGQLGLQVRRPHVHPHDAASCDGGVGGNSDLVLEVALGGLRGHVHAAAFNVELPAVVDAPEPRLFVPAEKEARAAMGAVVVKDADVPLGVPEGHKVLAQEAQPHGRAVRLRDLLFHEPRHPEPTQQLAHGCPRTYPGEKLVVALAQHATPPVSLQPSPQSVCIKRSAIWRTIRRPASQCQLHSFTPVALPCEFGA